MVEQQRSHPIARRNQRLNRRCARGVYTGMVNPRNGCVINISLKAPMITNRVSERLKQLKPAQAARLVAIARDEMRQSRDRDWAVQLLSESGLDIGALLGSTKAERLHTSGKNGKARQVSAGKKRVRLSTSQPVK